MSKENVERLQAAYRALATGDISTVLEMCSPDIEITEPREIPDSSTFHGHQGVRGVLGKLQEVFPDMEFAPDEFIAHGNRILVSMQWLGTGASSGVRSQITLFHVWGFEGDLATRVQAFLDRREALEAAGLSE